MWSSDRRTLLLGLAALAGCGFSPAYGPGGAAEGLRGSIEVDAPSDEDGYRLVRRLEERLGRPAGAQYRLSASLALGEDGLGITPDQEITRYRLSGELTWALRRLSDDVTVSNGLVRNFTEYSAPVFGAAGAPVAGNTVSVLTARRDARERLMVILADQLVSRLIATAPEWRR
ncbi:LPS assembly lipoprotein LptE [Oceaniglobus roseus]|uniref:LPS assembly lipoprotein LptE n=1 Tax=Oceaniglobus roseus TaxID=1737570 RepID=UPI000C7E8E4F|nr:LPS assembly lipoprotein LptE [Kandeliimicrobium roseum]